jgi:hypothetical protein
VFGPTDIIAAFDEAIPERRVGVKRSLILYLGQTRFSLKNTNQERPRC